MTEPRRIRTERRGHVFLIGLDREDKRNAFDVAMLRQLAQAYTEFEDDPELRCAVVHAEGAHFTAGLDLGEVGPKLAAGEDLFPEGTVDPMGVYGGRQRSKPVVIAVQGWCLTIGIELSLACDIRIGASDVKFGQIEVNRGIFPFGGATLRLPQVAGWGNAMRWLLTGDTFGAEEALRIGLLQEVVAPGTQVDRAVALAETIASRAPLAVQATLWSAREATESGMAAAAAQLVPATRKLMGTEDAAEGFQSFLERREASFKGR